MQNQLAPYLNRCQLWPYNKIYSTGPRLIGKIIAVMMNDLSVCDLNRLNLDTYMGRAQLRQDLETLGVPSVVSLWVSDLVENQEARVKSAFTEGRDDHNQ